MSGEEETKKGLGATLKGWFSGGSDDSPNAEVIPFEGGAEESETPDLFHIDPEWRIVRGGWEDGRNACSTDVETIRSNAMGQVSQFRSTVQTEEDRLFLARLYEQLGERNFGLPDFPETPLKLDQLLKEEEPNYQQVMRCIEADPKLVGRVWARARSARFPSAPSSLDMAVSRIGMVEVWRLSIETALDSLEIRAGVFKEWAEAVRIRGALVGEVTAGLAGQHRGPAFLAGLLHGVGDLIVLQIASLGSPERSTVQNVINLFHSDFAVMVADAWRLDPAIVPAVAYQHDPTEINAGPRELPRLLCLATIAVYGELDRRAERNSQFIQAMSRFTRSRVLASKSINLAVTALDRMDSDGVYSG